MLKKTVWILCCCFIASGLFSFTNKKQKALKTIIIDAGHGMMSNGNYNGAKGSYSYEDEICLEVAQKLVADLGKELPDIKIIQTRPNKNIVDLRERANIANRSRGDLFISIHVNAAPPIQHREFAGYRTSVSYTGKGKKKKKIVHKIPEYHYYSTPNPTKGTETYIWGAHKNEDKEVALRENAPMLGEENFEEKYGNIDPNSPDFIAMSLLKTKQFFKRSSTLAGMVEDEFARVGRSSRGAHQRSVGIWVLQATAMPSILVETGYITNRQEEDYLNSNDGQQEIAECITDAVKNYVSWIEKQQTMQQSSVNVVSTNKDSYSFLKQLDEHEQAARSNKQPTVN